jgi:HK97 family phage major capsid protein
MSVVKLRQQAGEAIAKARAVTDIAVQEGRDLSEVEQKSYDAAMAEHKALQANIKRIEDIDGAAASMAQAVVPPPGSALPPEAGAEGQHKSLPPRLPAEAVVPETREEKVDVVGGMVFNLARTKGNAGDAIRTLEAIGTPQAQRIAKALSSSVPGSGGYTVQQELATAVIELLTPLSAVRSAKPNVIELMSGNMSFARVTGGATGSYIGENTNIAPSDLTFDNLTLSGKSLAAMVPISNSLLSRSSAVVDTMVRNDMMRALAETSDQAFLRAAGSAFVPKGLRYWATPGNIFAANASPTLDNVIKDLAKMEAALAVANVTRSGRCWFMNETVAIFLKSLLNAHGVPVFKAELDQGRLNGYPVFFANNIPVNLGGTGDLTEIMLVAMSDVILAEEKTLTIDLSTEATYAIAGVQYNAFQLNQTVMRAITVHDLGVRHPQAVAVLHSAAWHN